MSPERASPGAGPDAGVTRRDFINGALAGAGIALLNGAPPRVHANPTDAEWTGYGGIGDYADANGNTAAVVEAAHRLRAAGALPADAGAGRSEPETYDLVIVGAGLAGLHAAYEVMRHEGTSRRCLVLDNHPMFGGEAKQNEFLVDGHRLTGPQGSNDFLLPREGELHQLWMELGLPEHFEFAPVPAGAPVAPLDHFGPMFWQASRAPVGYFFGNGKGSGTWVIDAWRDGFSRAPLDARLRRDLARLWNLEHPPPPEREFPLWLDGMTYGDFLTKVLRLDPRVADFVDPLLAAANYGFGSDVISAYAAYYSWLPGVRAYFPSAHLEDPGSDNLMSFPGGNSAIARALVRKMLPHALADTFTGTTNRDALDDPESWLRIRLGSTVMHVVHESPQELAITYARQGRMYRVRARAAVLASGAWVNRRILGDAPGPLRAALNGFEHGPMLVANVALRQWSFLARLGFCAARWFEGFGFFAGIRRPMRIAAAAEPFDPKAPTVLTLYVPIAKRGGDLRTQAIAARNALLSASYRDYERAIRNQLTKLFASAGFDAERDIAGIILNRWGHAYLAPRPGFLLGENGAPAPLSVVKKGYGRIRFGHSELAGAQNWPNAATEGMRAAREALALL